MLGHLFPIRDDGHQISCLHHSPRVHEDTTSHSAQHRDWFISPSWICFEEGCYVNLWCFPLLRGHVGMILMSALPNPSTTQVQRHVHEQVAELMSWSMRCALHGEWPNTGFMDEPLPDSLRARLAGTSLSFSGGGLYRGPNLLNAL